MHGILDKAEVTTGFAIAVNEHVVALDHGGGPFGDDGGIGTIRVLSLAEHIEVAQANGGKAVATGKHVGIQLVHVLGDSIGRERLADDVFYLGQAGVVAVGRTAGGVGKAFYLGITGSHQHVEKAVYVGAVGGDGVVNGAWHRAQCGFMQHVVHACTGLLAVFQIADVAFDKLEACPLLRGNQ